MADLLSLWPSIAAAPLLIGLAVAAVWDLRSREVPDRLWQILGVLGAALGAVVFSTAGGVALFAWLLTVGLALQHVFPWDELGDERGGAWADVVEVALYVGVTAIIALLGASAGVGGGGVPLAAIALLATILVARALFEIGVLFGGADAKAVIIAGVLVPLFAQPWLGVPERAQLATSVIPMPINMLMDAALASLAIPLAVAVLNGARGEFSWTAGFTTYSIPVADLPDRFVWVRDPRAPVDRDEEDAIETSAEDRAWRIRIAERLRQQGIDRVRVGPQIPFILLLAVGALGALLAGNWLLDLLAAL